MASGKSSWVRVLDLKTEVEFEEIRKGQEMKDNIGMML